MHPSERYESPRSHKSHGRDSRACYSLITSPSGGTAPSPMHTSHLRPSVTLGASVTPCSCAHNSCPGIAPMPQVCLLSHSQLLPPSLGAVTAAAMARSSAPGNPKRSSNLRRACRWVPLAVLLLAALWKPPNLAEPPPPQPLLRIGDNGDLQVTRFDYVVLPAHCMCSATS